MFQKLHIQWSTFFDFYPIAKYAIWLSEIRKAYVQCTVQRLLHDDNSFSAKNLQRSEIRHAYERGRIHNESNVCRIQQRFNSKTATFEACWQIAMNAPVCAFRERKQSTCTARCSLACLPRGEEYKSQYDWIQISIVLSKFKLVESISAISAYNQTTSV